MRRFALFMFIASLAEGAPIAISQAGAFFHGNGVLISQLDGTSAGYFSTLDADNHGSFGWSITNTSGVPITNAAIFLFLDAELDSVLNTYFNEFGTFVSLTLPPSAPVGATAAGSWEIDEPGFVFGDIFNNLLTGTLDNTNAVPFSAPDDVSLALGFGLGTLNPGQTATVTGQIRLTNIGGLSHSDPGSNYQFYFNGFSTLDQAAPTGVPEPSSWGPLSAIALAFITRRVFARSVSNV
jgi:hypothetical protein